MQRHTRTPRPDWQKLVAEKGLTYHSLPDGSPYWDESAYWEFSSSEIDRLEAATAEIQKLALAAGDFILRADRLDSMHIPRAAAKHIRATWQSEPPALYGRLDLAYDGAQIKLLEYNADTPTALVEAAVTQWYWLEDCFPHADQFNSLHEKLVAKWKDLRPYLRQPVYFAWDGGDEDLMTISYLRETAAQAGHRNLSIEMKQIGWEQAKACFVDLDRKPIESVFKLYPWEWLLNDAFGANALATMNTVQWIEPIWKMLWSNKALLAILWELNAGHELLLPAYLDGPRGMKDYVRKPLFGREGAGITVFRNGSAESNAPYTNSDTPAVYQALASLAHADGNYAVIGSWLVDGEPAGVGIRESDGPITTNSSRFVPHLFR